MDIVTGDNATPDHDVVAEKPSGTFRTMASFMRLAGGYWRGQSGTLAWTLTVACIVAVGMNVAVQFGINRWNKFFFDALEGKDTAAIVGSLGWLGILLVINISIAVLIVLARMRLQLDWRRWLSGTLIERWIAEQRFYRLSISAPEVDSPEFRIAEDSRIATEPIVEFGAGILNVSLMLIVFVSVLWTVGGNLELGGVVIPGFMVFVAVFYACTMSALMVFLGKPLVARIGQRSKAEAAIRQALGRARENAESIAILRGEAKEIEGITEQFGDVVRRWRRVITQFGVMTVLTSLNSTAAPLVPLIVMAPSYLQGRASLGTVMQTAAAFVQVQTALSWLVDNYARIAEWLASASRVLQLSSAFDDLDESVGPDSDGIIIGESADDRVYLEGLSVARHDGRVMIAESDTSIVPGEKILLTGASGTGKSTLIRAIAGLWPWGSGRILLPVGARIAFLPQRPYLRPGSLRSVLDYTSGEGVTTSDEVLRTAMIRCGLRRFIPRLDEEAQWDKILSGGEQQRIGFVRLLLQHPNIVVMDEATSALDTDAQDSMMGLFQNELKDCTVITVGHRPELAEFHSRMITLSWGRGGAVIKTPPEASRPTASQAGGSRIGNMNP